MIQSHGGSGKQALEVANGLEADVVTLALEGDVQVVADAGMIEDGFEDEFDQESSPYTSTIVFLVRKDNPKNIADWDDLLREDVGVITPNPKTSGGARWNYLAAWYYFESQGQSGEEITENMKTLYHNVLVLDSGARGATTTFAENFYRPSDPDVFLIISVHRGSASSRNCRQTENGSWMTLHSRILRTLVDGVRRRRSISRTAECLKQFMNSD